VGWADESGQRFGDDPDIAHLKPDPCAYPAALGERCIAGKGRNGRVNMAAAGENSMLKVRLETRGMFHDALAARGSRLRRAARFECCGWPGRLRPPGRRCRRCGAALAAEDAA
jgi:hypothetical protein